MSFDSLLLEIDRRYEGAIDLFNVVCKIRSKVNTQRMKGLAFVEMYSFYEHAVSTSVQHALSSVQSVNLPYSKFPDGIVSLAVTPLFQSCRDSPKSKRWKKQLELLNEFNIGTSSSTNIEAFPDDGTHFRRGQLETLWLIFDLTGKIVPDKRLFPLVNEIVGNRNAIAHGRECPETIGCNYSTGDIRKKFKQTRRICKHVIQKIQAKTSSITT